MYVIRRVWTIKPGETRRAATIVDAIGKHYETAGKRSPSTVYFNSGTLPGDADRVYMEWTEEAIESPYRASGQVASPDEARALGAKLRDIRLESWIEFYELMTPEKEMDLS
jgi:hypothetical protein